MNRWLLLAMCVLLVSGCGTVASGRKIDYRNTQSLPSLEVPPDLAKIPEPSTAGGGTSTATYSGYAGEQKSQGSGANAVLPQYPNVKLARDGQTRFVVVNAQPAAVWDKVKAFLTNTGLTIMSENSRAGLIETDWAENHALVGAKESNFLSKWLQSFYSVGTRDKYYVRLERGSAPETTEVYIVHRGMEELDPDEAGAARPGWKPRASDPELEAEMLHRLAAFIGGPTADTQIASNAPVEATSPPSAKLTRNGNGASLLTLEDRLDRAWRRVGLSLDRIGFTVEDRDRSKGIYYVRYIDPDTQAKQKGFFSRMFSSDAPAAPNQFQVLVKSADNGSSVEVLDKEGSPEVSKTGERILSLLYEQLK